MTGVAQVFDERGEGLIVQGGSASYDKDDRSPHLSRENALVHRFQSSNHIRRLDRVCKTTCGRPGPG
jgi:hypothetical protein